MARRLRAILGTIDRVSSRLLGREGSVRNIRSQLDDQRRAVEAVELLERRLAALAPVEVVRAA